MDNPILTYIIPYYNGQDTINRLLDSIYGIPFNIKEFEVIIVDDCSPIYAEKNIKPRENLKIIRHEKNLRQGGAKNTGIKMAAGEYIAFADQDDTIVPTYIKEILLQTIQEHPDIIICQANRITSNKSISTPKHPLQSGACLTGVHFCETYYDPSFSASPWSNIYRRQFLLETNHPMAENTLLEDVDWVQYHLFFSKKIINYNYPIYNWHIHPQSVSHTNSARLYAAFIAYGYRKINNSRIFRPFSAQFADLVLNDGKYNIASMIRMSWKSPQPWKIFNKKGCGELSNTIWDSIMMLHWDKWTKFLIRNRELSAIIMTLGFPLRWTRWISHLIKRHFYHNQPILKAKANDN